jgi:hypothetical protein
MSGLTGFRGTVNGSVQSSYTDQPRVAYPGQLAFSSDDNLVDAAMVGDTNGVFAGQGVRLDLNVSTEPGNLQSPNVLANQPTGGETEALFGGIVVFDEACQSDSLGNPGWNKGRIARVLRNRRQGGRIWVTAPDAVVVSTSTVNWVTTAGSDGLHPLGSFASTALAGNSTVGYSVAITKASFVTACAAGGYAIIEFNGY